MQVECNGKTKKRSFIRLDTAEPPLIFYKDNASERQKSLLLFVRVPLIFYKDNANERQKSLLLFVRVPLIFYKDNANERQKSLLLFVRVPLIFYKCTEINYNNQIICRFLSDFIT